MVNANTMDWSSRLDDAIYAYQTTYKTLKGMSPYQLVYGKSCHWPFELEHKDMWAMKKRKMDLNEVVEQRLNRLNEIDEFHLKAYESLSISKDKMKKYHEQKI